MESRAIVSATVVLQEEGTDENPHNLVHFSQRLGIYMTDQMHRLKNK
jgi:hypothetical protein